jgi:hypothetical protein
MISPLGYKILTELPVIGQDTIVSSSLLLPFKGGPFGLYQDCFESAQTLHETEAWSTHLQPIPLFQQNGVVWVLFEPYYE